MGLFDTSVITNLTKGNASTVTNQAALLGNSKTATSGDTASAKSGSMGGLASATSSIPSAITDGATTAVTSTTSSITSEVSSILSSTTSAVNSAVSGVESTLSSVFGSVTSGISSGFKSVTDDLFSDSSTDNKTAAAIKTGVPDPITSSFANGTPKSTLFKTTSATTGLTPQTIGTTTKTTDNSILGSMSVLTKRYGTDLIGDSTTSAKNFLNSTVKSSAVSGLFSGVSSVVGTAQGVYSSVQTGISTVGSTLSGVYQGGLSEFRNAVSGLATDLTGNSLGMDGTYNSSLPSVTDLNGNAISGVPTGTSFSSLSSLFGTAKSLGCAIDDVGYTAYSATQSIYGALLGIAAQTNLTGLLQNLLNCNRFDNYGANIAKQLFYQNAGSQINVASTIADKLGGSQIASTSTLTKSIVTNPSLTSSDTGTVSSLLTTLGSSGDEPYSTSSTIGSDTLWDLSTLSNSNSVVKQSLLSSDNADLAYLTGGTELNYSLV